MWASRLVTWSVPLFVPGFTRVSLAGVLMCLAFFFQASKMALLKYYNTAKDTDAFADFRPEHVEDAEEAAN